MPLACWPAGRGSIARAAFNFEQRPALALVGAIILGCSLAPLAFELIILSQQLGIATITEEQLAEKAPLVNRLVAQWRLLSPALVFAAIALVPAVGRRVLLPRLFARVAARPAAGLAGDCLHRPGLWPVPRQRRRADCSRARSVEHGAGAGARLGLLDQPQRLAGHGRRTR